MVASEPALQLDLGGQEPPKAKPAKGLPGDSQCGRREAEESLAQLVPFTSKNSCPLVKLHVGYRLRNSKASWVSAEMLP